MMCQNQNEGGGYSLLLQFYAMICWWWPEVLKSEFAVMAHAKKLGVTSTVGRSYIGRHIWSRTTFC